MTKAESLTKWFKFGKTCSKEEFKALTSSYPKVDFEILPNLNRLGENGSLTTSAQMANLNKIMPGYFGPKGLEIIADKLSEIFINTGIIGNFNCMPQTPIEYLFEVMVPETAVHLIIADLECEYVDATKIIEDSVAYGSIVNPLDKKP
ncbi:15217_t:CDS:2, partial [Cetraspora pellucida]